MKKLILPVALLFLIAFAVYIVITTPKSIGYYTGEGGNSSHEYNYGVLSYDNREYLHIEETDLETDKKLGFVTQQSKPIKRWEYFDIFNIFSDKDYIFTLKGCGEENYLVVVSSYPIMETTKSLYVNVEQKTVPIEFIPAVYFKEGNKLSIQKNDYFFFGSVSNENLIGNKFAEVKIENESVDILSVNDSVNDEWIALENGDKYSIYSKKKELLTSVPAKLFLDLEINSVALN